MTVERKIYRPPLNDFEQRKHRGLEFCLSTNEEIILMFNQERDRRARQAIVLAKALKAKQPGESLISQTSEGLVVVGPKRLLGGTSPFKYFL